MTVSSRSVRSTGTDVTHALGRQLAAELTPGILVALTGDLGTGKTALVRGICDGLGCGEQVTSPTFTIVNEYVGIVRVTHCDLYRLDSISEMLDIGLDDVFRSDAVVLVEWAERARPLLPVPRLEIRCSHGDDDDVRLLDIVMCEDDATSLLPRSHESF